MTVRCGSRKMNEVIAKRLALNMALMCVRNTCIEDVHAGVEPSSKAGDFSDAKLVYPNSIHWRKTACRGVETQF